MKAIKYITIISVCHTLVFFHFYMIGTSALNGVKPTDVSQDITYLVKNPLDVEPYPKRFFCGQWKPTIGWLHIYFDIGLFVAYMTFPAYLMAMLYRIKHALNSKQKFLFYSGACFFVFCALIHLTEAIIFFLPIYNLSLLLKAVGFTISAIAAATFIWLYQEFANIFWIERRITPIKRIENDHYKSD